MRCVRHTPPSTGCTNKNLIYEKNIEYIRSSASGNYFFACRSLRDRGRRDGTRHRRNSFLRRPPASTYPISSKGATGRRTGAGLTLFTGIGDEKALKILRKVRETFHIPVVTDVHTAQEAVMAAEYVDVPPDPGIPVSPDRPPRGGCRDRKVCQYQERTVFITGINGFRVRQGFGFGNSEYAVTERGTFFGYGDLVVDMRSIPVMRSACECPGDNGT